MPRHFGAQVLNVQKNVVLLLPAIWLENDFLLLLVRLLFVLLCQVPVNLNIYCLELICVFIPAFVLNLQMYLFQFHFLSQVFSALKLNLNHEKVLTRHTIAVRVDRALQHLKLTLCTNLNAISLNERPVCKFGAL